MAIRILQEIEIWNILHERDIRAGKRAPLRVIAKADNGSTYTLLPAEIAQALDLLPAGWVWLRYADGRRGKKRKVAGLRLRIPGLPDREITTDAVVEPNRDQVLLGCEEMERMELVADHKAGVLLPRRGTERGITFEAD